MNFDVPRHLLPPNVWWDIFGMRPYNGTLRKVRGRSLVRTPSFTPYGLFYVLGASSHLWVYAGLTDVRAFSGSTDTEITRAAGDYTGTASDEWNGGVFNGMLVMNNGVDLPQLWNPPSTGQLLINLPNWTSTWRAKVIRPFKNFLVALDVTKTSTRFRRMVKWSHTADSSYPSSWDETDTTKDAGENNLPDEQVALVDCLPLGEVNIVYTEQETWRMSLSGTSSIFNFVRIFPKSGLLGQQCAVEFEHNGVLQHFAVSRSDIIVHNGSSKQSVADSRVRETFFTSLDKRYSQFTKVALNKVDKEIWVCYPNKDSGDGILRTALVWNYATNVWSNRLVPAIRSIISSPLQIQVSTDLWSSDNLPWDAEVLQTWNATEITQLEDTLLMGRVDSPLIYSLTESVANENGLGDVSTVTRDGIISVQSQQGIVQDPMSMKLLTAVWPHIEVPSGNTITLRVRVAAKEKLTGGYAYTNYLDFIPGTDEKVDIPNGGVEGRYLLIEFGDRGEVGVDWRLSGYELDIEVLGGR